MDGRPCRVRLAGVVATAPPTAAAATATAAAAAAAISALPLPSPLPAAAQRTRRTVIVGSSSMARRVRAAYACYKTMRLLSPRYLALLLLAVRPCAPAQAQPVTAPSQGQPVDKCDYSQIEISDECPSQTGFNWEQYGELLYISRGMVFSGEVEVAKAQVLQLLTQSTTPFFRAFECPLAVAATYFALAQILAFQGRFRRALALVHMGFVFTRDKGFSECTPWPVQGWEMLLAGRNLAEKVRELDMQSVRRDVPKSFRFQSSRIAVVTICAYAEDEPVRLISDINHRQYAALHGYDLFFYTDKSQIAPHAAGRMDVTDGVHKPFFWKVNAVRNVLDSQPSYDWVLWADCDAFFMDPERTLDSIIHMYADNLTFATTGPLPPRSQGTLSPELLPMMQQQQQQQQQTPVSLILAVDSTGINNGVWLLRNDAWARKFLDDWWHSDILQGAGADHNCSDQSTMQHFLLQERALALDTQWDAVEGPIWPAEVRVAAQEHLQSFHAATAATVLSREWQEGDFIKHHPGCHYYKEPCQHMYYSAALHFDSKMSALHKAR